MIPPVRCEVKDWGLNELPSESDVPLAPTAPKTETPRKRQSDEDCVGPHRRSASSDGQSSSRLIAQLSTVSIGGVFGRSVAQAGLKPPTEEDGWQREDRPQPSRTDSPDRGGEPERNGVPRPASQPVEERPTRYPGLQPPPC